MTLLSYPQLTVDLLIHVDWWTNPFGPVHAQAARLSGA